MHQPSQTSTTPVSCDNFPCVFKGTPAARHRSALSQRILRRGIAAHRQRRRSTGKKERGARTGATRVSGRQAFAAPYTKRASGRGGLPHVRWPASRRANTPPPRCLRGAELARTERPSSMRPASCRRGSSKSRALAALASLPRWRFAPPWSATSPGKIIGAYQEDGGRAAESLRSCPIYV
jgi:hypothetical protein